MSLRPLEWLEVLVAVACLAAIGYLLTPNVGHVLKAGDGPAAIGPAEPCGCKPENGTCNMPCRGCCPGAAPQGCQNPTASCR